MVALGWDRRGGNELVERRSTRLHLYVSPEEHVRPEGHVSPEEHVGPEVLRPAGAGPGPGAGDRRLDGRHPDRRRAVRRWKYAVRRALVVVVIASLGALAWSVAERLVAVASTGGGNAVGCTSSAAMCPGTRAYVAAPGDTVWSIAVRFAHGGDPRPLVERLEAEIGGGVLQPGQRLAVP